ncbi:MAG: beta-ketoacyl-[acyl-carrier-protein] synthase family protein [Firmicutes bacterium]|nr:beta-ketoacyl-[acyl-carrier-protein] synthase family protein [Bacillota bacterium]
MTTNKNRCVVTGLGMISAIGSNVSECWQNAVNGVSGIKTAEAVDTTDCYANLAAEVHDNTLDDICGTESINRVSRLCIKASGEAMRDAGLTDFADSPKAAVIMGSCVGGVSNAERYYKSGKSAEYVSEIPISPIANHIAEVFHAGGVVTNIANACAAGTISVAYACDLIRSGKADIVIAGGADAFAAVPFAGFLSLRALDAKPCSPFNRCGGITLGEGAGALIIESYEHASKRNAHIYCDVLGAGVSGDAHHITAPRPDGKGQIFAIRRAAQNSGIDPSEIGYINAHGTGTAKNDEAEFLSLHTIFDGVGSDLSVSSTKAMVGHCLGAAGAIEAVFAIKALTEGVIPPTIGYADEDMPRLAERAGKIDFCPNTAREKQLSTVMSNSFAFGGNNASVVFSKNTGNIVPPAKRERVFITGIGTVSPIGNGLDNYIEKIKERKPLDNSSAESSVERSDYDACGLTNAFCRKLDKFSRLQAVSGMNALADAGLSVMEDNTEKIGIVVGTSDGPLSTICDYQQDLLKKGNSSGSAFKFPNTVYNAAGGYLSICSGIRGYNVTLTNGIQSGLASITYAVNIIESGNANAVLATGTDENSEIVTELYDKMGYFADSEFKLSDGSTTLVLESLSGMDERGAKPYAEVLGCGTACKSGALKDSESALERAISFALDDAGITVDDVDGIVGFANGLNEVEQIENEMINNIFAERAGMVPVFNIHSVTGEGRAATAALSAAHAALILAGKLGNTVESENLGGIEASSLKNLLVVSYGSGGVYTAVIMTR